MHSLHVGYVGVMGNLHYLEILDFVAGLPGWDLAGDDKATWLAQQEASQQELASLPAEPAEAPLPPPRRTARTKPTTPVPPPRRTARRKPTTLDPTSLNWRP